MQETIGLQNPHPYFSIIVPVYNAEKTLAKCLTAIFDSSFQNFEVIIVNDASSDTSGEIARSFPCRLVNLDANCGASRARNHGARNAAGEVLLFIDSDVVIRKDTLMLFKDSLEHYPAVFGIYSPCPGVSSILSWYQNFYAHKSIMETNEITSMFYSYCAAIKKELFHEVGGFDENWTRATFEDVELGMRVAAKGHRIYLNKNITVVHYNYYTLQGFFRNYFYKSRELAKFMAGRKRLTLNNEGWASYKNLASFLAGLSILPCGVLVLVSRVFMVPLAAGIIIFIVMNAAFYTFIMRKKTAALLPALLLNVTVQIVSALGMLSGFTRHLKQKEQHEAC